MSSSERRRSFAAHLRRPDAVDVRDRLARARDRGYWRALAAEACPELPLLVDELPAFPAAPAPLEREALLSATASDGFFVTPPVVSDDVCQRALRAIDVVAEAGWPRVFAFVYDALWSAVRAPPLVGLFTALLGDGAQQLPGVWVHRVSPVAGARGWGPHVDVPGPARRMPDGAPSRLTAWLALTDATVDNGCLHVVPAPFAGGLGERFHEQERADMNDVIRLLHGTRALPVAAGSLVAWRLDVLHWGGVSTGESNAPRVSLSFELGHEGAPPALDEEPGLALRERVPFETRLLLIGRGLLAYGKAEEREPYAHRFVALGEELVDAFV